MAVGAGIAIGAFLIVIDQTSDESGLVPLVMSRATNTLITGATIGVLALARGARRTPGGDRSSGRRGPSIGATPPATPISSTRSSRPEPAPVGPLRAAWLLAVACGVLDAAANAPAAGGAAPRRPGRSCRRSPRSTRPGTILLAAIVLRERIAAVQWIGLALALIAGGMLALA